MEINRIGTTGYPAWRKTEKPQQNAAGKSFADQVDHAAGAFAPEGTGQNANVQDIYDDLKSRASENAAAYEERAFAMVGANAPKEVMRAWDQALAETGVSPFPMNRISTALVLHVESGRQGLSAAFLGSSAGSAKSMAKRIIERLENPLTPAADPEFARKELLFYRKFVECLS